jgi:hypothetical protein
MIQKILSLFGGTPYANEIKLGQHTVVVDFGDAFVPGCDPAVFLGGYEEPIVELSPAGIESAVRAIVARKVADDQIDIDRTRLIEDVRRALGN